MPLFYEDLSIGQTFTSPGRTVTETDLMQFAMLSGAWNPIHTDREFAARTLYGKPVVHGVFGITLLTGLIDRMGLFHGSAIAMLGIRDWQFKGPIFIGDTLHFIMEIVAKRLTSKGPWHCRAPFPIAEPTRRGCSGGQHCVDGTPEQPGGSTHRMTKLLENQTAVVTGGAQGIGFAIAHIFAEHGARLVIGDINGEQAEVACKQLAAMGTQAVAVQVDVRDQQQVQQMVERAVSEFGQLDVLLNNAGVTRDATLRKMTLGDWETVIDVHLKGTWLGTQAAAAVMREQKRGSIVNISSISGKVGMIGQTNYSAAKAGMVGLTKAAAKELAYLNIRVNVVQPGLIRTAMTEVLRPEIWEKKLAEVPMGRAGEPSEVAKVVLFLASDLASYMTGTVLEVTGGRYM